MANPKVPKRKTERAPAVDKLMKPVTAIIVALLGYFILQGIQGEIPRIDASDALALREVFFGEGEGKDYAVLCHDDSTSIPVSSAFQDAKSDASVPAEFVLLNCNYILPDSGKSIAERFELNLKKRPTIFVSGKQGPPKQIPEKHLKTGNMLVKALKYNLEPRTEKIENTKQLKQKCLNKDLCALFLKGGPPDKKVKKAMQDLIVTYPQVTFASIDATTLILTNLEDHVPMFTKGEHQFLMFQKVSGGLDAPKTTAKDSESKEKPKSTRLITSVAPFTGKPLSFSGINTFVNKVANGSIKAKKISSLPVVKTRTKKLEEQERQKRQRAKNRSENNQNQQQQQSTGSGAFPDGSKEARKAERDKRRSEHAEKNNVKPLTPEELSERERQRRLRMEEEAAKWNMMPDDAPEEGDPVEDEEFDIGMEDVEDEEIVDIDEEEDEDVLDLD